MTLSSFRLTTPGMRRMLYIASGLVFLVGVPLFLLPNSTATYFSWTVNPPITAMFLGAAYWSSFCLEFFCARELYWDRARVAVPAVLLFTFLTLVATLLHIDKFHFGSDFQLITQLGTWVWLGVYAFVPPVLAFLWFQQSKVSGTNSSASTPLPTWVKRVLIVHAGIFLPLGVLFFIVPTQVTPLFWSWSLSALTGRAVGAWLLGIGTAAAHMAWEDDLARSYGGLIGYTMFGVLELIALARFATARTVDTNELIIAWGSWQAWAYLLILLSVVVAGGYGWHLCRQARS
jgi:hypothetical protein